MSEIQELVGKLRTEHQTESIIADLDKKGKFNRFSEASKLTIRELGSIGVYELGEISKTVQCQACLKYALEGLHCCPRGACFMPSPEQKRKIKTHFEIMSVPFYSAREGDSRGAKHGQTQWQYDHRKARDAKKRCAEERDISIVQRWQEDETYRASHTAHGWTEEYCSYLDYLAPIDLSYVATWKERSRYENSLCSNSMMENIQGE